MNDTSIEQQAEASINAAHNNLVARLETAIQRTLVTLKENGFPGVVRKDVYRPVEKKRWWRKSPTVTYEIDKGIDGEGVACWELNNKLTRLLLADGSVALYGLMTDRALAELLGCEPTINYVTFNPYELDDDLLEQLIEAVGALQYTKR